MGYEARLPDEFGPSVPLIRSLGQFHPYDFYTSKNVLTDSRAPVFSSFVRVFIAIWFAVKYSFHTMKF